MNQQDDDKDRSERGTRGESGYGKSGGNAGAGRSGKEDMGSEKPSDGAGLGSNKPGKPAE